MSQQQISADVTPEEQAAAEAARQSLAAPGYTITTNTIWHRAHGRTQWKVRCLSPVPVLDKGGQPKFRDGRMLTTQPPAIRVRAETPEEAKAKYREDQKIAADVELSVSPVKGFSIPPEGAEAGTEEEPQ